MNGGLTALARHFFKKGFDLGLIRRGGAESFFMKRSNRL